MYSACRNINDFVIKLQCIDGKLYTNRNLFKWSTLYCDLTEDLSTRIDTLILPFTVKHMQYFSYFLSKFIHTGNFKDHKEYHINMRRSRAKYLDNIIDILTIADYFDIICQYRIYNKFQCRRMTFCVIRNTFYSFLVKSLKSYRPSSTLLSWKGIRDHAIKVRELKGNVNMYELKE